MSKIGKVLGITGAIGIAFVMSSCVKSGQAISKPSNEASIGIDNKDETNKEENQKSDSKEEIIEVFKENDNNILVVCNKNISLGSEYVPDDLVVPDVALVYPETAQQSHLREVAAEALEEMFEDAKKEGLKDLYLVSGYRSYAYQEEIYNNSVKNRGKEYTDKYMAVPGHSEHQTGLVADISTKEMNFTLEENFDQLEEGKWLAENAYKYGFILRYPKDRIEDTGYNYESWHFRYVGKEVSKYIKENNLILEDVYNQVNESIDAVG